MDSPIILRSRVVKRENYTLESYDWFRISVLQLTRRLTWESLSPFWKLGVKNALIPAYITRFLWRFMDDVDKPVCGGYIFKAHHPPRDWVWSELTSGGECGGLEGIILLSFHRLLSVGVWTEGARALIFKEKLKTKTLCEIFWFWKHYMPPSSEEMWGLPAYNRCSKIQNTQ